MFPKKKPLKLLICGNTFVSGEHGVFIVKNQNKKTILKEVAKAILHFVNNNTTLKNIITDVETKLEEGNNIKRPNTEWEFVKYID